MKPLTAAALLALIPAAAAQTNLRGWSEHGQTWLVWEDDLGLGSAGGVDTYSVYRSDQPIADTSGAELAGRLFGPDWTAIRLQIAAPGATFTIPDGAGGTYTLSPTEAVFVYTSHVAAAEHFAVVRTGDTVPPAGATTGPIAPSADPVTAHPQLTGLDAGHPYTVYAHWVDGRADHAAGSAQYPVMGNEHFHGTAHVFAVFEPVGALPPAPRPAALFLHGGGGSYWKFRPSQGGAAGFGFESGLQDGLLVTLDQAQNVYTDAGGAPAVQTDFTSLWIGTADSYDRFASQSLVPPDDALVVDYTQRRIDFVIDWLVAHRGVDPRRVAMGGLSGGGRGTLAYVRARPGRISAALCFVATLIIPPFIAQPASTGTLAQDLATTLPSGVGIFTYLDPSVLLVDEDLPYLRAVWGVNDTQVSWSFIPPAILALEAERPGWHLEWDQRKHTNGAGWAGAHFFSSPRYDLQALTAFASDASFPAFSDVDHDVAKPGTQPEPVDPPGQVFGSRGGWIDWDAATLVDAPASWSVELAVRSGSAFANDDAPAPTATLSVTVRRPQAFLLVPHQTFAWSLTDVASGTVLQSGAGTADAGGRAAVEGLAIDVQPSRLALTALPSSWTPLGQGLAGGSGLPELASTSSLVPGSPLVLELSSAAPNAPAFLVIGTGELGLPLLGGTLVPAPDLVLPGATDGSGTASWGAAVPPGFAPGLGLVFQAWVIDPAAPAGLAASGGLRGLAL